VAIPANEGSAIGRRGESSLGVRGRLSPRQREVLDGILAGKPNRIIAQDLILSTRTVEAHRAAIMSKVGVSSVAELVQATSHSSGEGDRLDMMCRIYPGLISYWDSGLIVRFANHRHEMSFGKKVDDILGNSMDEVFGASCCRRDAPFIQGVLSGKSQYFTQVLRMPDGRLTTFCSVYSPQFDMLGDVEGFFAFMMDTCALPNDGRAGGDAWPRAAAREAENASLWAEMLLDDDNRIVSVNNAFTDITQFGRDEVRGQTPIMIKPLGVEPSAFMRFWVEILAEREWQGTVWYRRRDGYLFRSRQRVIADAGRRCQVGCRVLFNEIIIP
jgi:DNA-binding CsgD family transcriptional regulator